MLELVMVLALVIGGLFYLIGGLVPGISNDPLMFIALGMIFTIAGLAMFYYWMRERRR